MPNQHPITPPQELIHKWHIFAPHEHDDEGRVLVPPGHLAYIATQAARWGADQELEACCEWLVRNYNYPQADHPLRAARRPKPLRLKEQALAVIENSEICDHLSPKHAAILRRALKALPE